MRRERTLQKTLRLGKGALEFMCIIFIHAFATDQEAYYAEEGVAQLHTHTLSLSLSV